MNTQQIDKIIIKLADILNQEYNFFELKDKYSEQIEYKDDEIGHFIDHLMQKGQKINLTFLKNHINKGNIKKLVEDIHFPILVFRKSDNGDYAPLIIYATVKKSIQIYNIDTDEILDADKFPELVPELMTYENEPNAKLNGSIVFITAFPLRHLVSDYHTKENAKPLSPLTRLIRLLKVERKDIGYIYTYAVIVGLISLVLPLGIQATVGLISGGMVFSSVIVLIGIVIAGILIGGILQMFQVSLVEILQQRVFAKAAYELAHRITRVKMESLMKYYPPELMNRFFDVVTLQKGLPKLFVDITGSVIQIIFGLILLSLYHPFFLIFSIVLVGFVMTIFYLTGPRGLETSIMESKYKYKIASWLEELARNVDSFKLAGNTNLPLQKMDELVNSYLFYRKSHFKVLLQQFGNIVMFKTVVTGGLLILGTILVVNRQISLGQFVASEVIIILVVNSVEKLIVSLDTIYDLLTSVDKIAAITDLPLEKEDGLHITLNQYEQGLHLQAKDLKYKYNGNGHYTLKDVNFEITPGESIVIAGANDSGKHTLVKVVTGILDSYEGILTINHISLHDINLLSLRDAINKNLTQDELFDGSILDNLTMGRSAVSYQDVIWAIRNVGLEDYVNSLKDGLYTHIGAGGKRLSGSITSKLILARSVISKPKLLIINDFSEHINKRDKMKILNFLLNKENGWTLIIISIDDDPLLFTSCDRIILMNEGNICTEGSYDTIINDENFQKLIFKGK